MFHLRATISQFTSTCAFYTLPVQHIWSTFKCQAWGHEVKQGIVQTQWTDGCGKGATKQTVQWGQHCTQECGHRSTCITKPCGLRTKASPEWPWAGSWGRTQYSLKGEQELQTGWPRHKVPPCFSLESTEEPECPAFTFPLTWALASPPPPPKENTNLCGPHLEYHSPGWARPENLHL